MNIFQRFKEYAAPRQAYNANALTKNPFTLIFCLFALLTAFAFTGCTWGGDTGKLSISVDLSELQQPQSKKPLPNNDTLQSLRITAYIAGEEDNLIEVDAVKDGKVTSPEIDFGIVPAGKTTVVIEAIAGTDKGEYAYYGSTTTVVRPGVNVVNIDMGDGCLIEYANPQAYFKTDSGVLSLKDLSVTPNEDAIVSSGLAGLSDNKFVIPPDGKIPAFRMRMLNNRPGDEAKGSGGAYHYRFMGYAVGGKWIEDFTAEQPSNLTVPSEAMELFGVWYDYGQWLNFEGTATYFKVSKQVGVSDGNYTDKLFIPEKYSPNRIPVTEIDSYAFQCTTNDAPLVEVNIPASVTYIGQEAFSGCQKLSKINFSGTIAQWKKIRLGNNVFVGVPPNTVVNCTDGKTNIQ